MTSGLYHRTTALLKIISMNPDGSSVSMFLQFDMTHLPDLPHLGIFRSMPNVLEVEEWGMSATAQRNYWIMFLKSRGNAGVGSFPSSI